jgi:N4-gp56 family major capsid protein
MALLQSNFASTVPAPVNFVLMEQLLSAARKRLPFFNGTLPGTLEKAKGAAAVKWRRIENLAAVTTTLSENTEGTTPTFGFGRSTVRPTITDVTAAISKFGNGISTTEEIDLFNVNSNSLALMDTLGANAGESLNTLMRNIFDGQSVIVRFGTQDGSTLATTLSSVAKSISLNDIQFSVNQLNRNSAMRFTPAGFGSTNIGTSPIRQSYYGICHVDVEEDIRGLTGFIPVEQYGGYTETEPGEFGAVGGVRWCSTEIAPILTGQSTESAVVGQFRNTGSAGATTVQHDVYTTYIYGREAVGSVGLGEQHAKEIYMMYDRVPTVEIIQHKPGSSGVADPFNENGTLVWKAWFAGKRLNENWLVKIHTLAKAY